MSAPTQIDSRARVVPQLPRAVLPIFFISGACALIDQIVWTRALYRIFGVTAASAATVLVAFMAGLALGSRLFGGWADRRRAGLRWYAVMELAIAVVAPLTLLLFKWLSPAYVQLANLTGLDSVWLAPLRGALCVLVLIVPTTLMGGTLPVLARSYLRGQPGRVMSRLYSINTWGAVCGCFLTGYVLLGTLGESRSLLLAAAGNLFAAAWAWRVSGRSTTKSVLPAAALADKACLAPGQSRVRRVVMLASFVNGFAALGLEVLWGRTLALFTDASVYAYTCIIGVFLIGIALGSWAAGLIADRVRAPLALVGWCIMLMGGVLAVTLWAFLSVVPAENIGGFAFMDGGKAIWFPLKLMGLAGALVLPLTLLSGACFPFFARLIIRSDGREGSDLGSVYSINTVGGILGSLCAGFVLLPLMHDSGGFVLIAGLYFVSGALCLHVAGSAVDSRRRPILAWATCLLGFALACALIRPDESMTRRLIARIGDIADHKESPAGTVTAMRRDSDGQKHLLVNGTGMTLLCTDTKLMAHLPLTLHPAPQNVLVICFGMGTSFRSAALHPVRLMAVELQPAVPKMFAYFHSDAPDIIAGANRSIRIGDGRNFLAMMSERYSIITIDPAPPMSSAGTVNLYTREFFVLCRDHLDDDGNVCLWLPDSCSTVEDLRLIVRTFRDVFAHVRIWMGPDRFGYYVIGAAKPLALWPTRAAAVGALPGFVQDLDEYGKGFPWTVEQLTKMQVMSPEQVDAFVRPEPRLLTDDHPYTEFPWWQWVLLGSDVHRHWMSPDRLRIAPD